MDLNIREIELSISLKFITLEAKMKLLVILLSMVTLTGCSTVIKGTPDRPIANSKEMQITNFAFEQVSFDEYRNANSSEKTLKRNEIIDARLRAYDLQFASFEEDLFAFGVGTGIGTDWTTLIISGLTAVTGGASTKAAFGAANTAIIGAKGSLDKRLLLDKTTPAIIAEMVSQRKAVLVDIRSGLSKEVKDYNLYQALADVERYRQAGTLAGGLNGIVKSAGQETKKNEAAIQKIIKGTYLEDIAGVTLTAFTNDAKSGVSNTSRLKQWMSANGLLTSPGSVPMFLNTAPFAALREQAVKDLKLADIED